VSGSGSALIDGVATFEMGGAFGENITLDTGAHATLRIIARALRATAWLQTWIDSTGGTGLAMIVNNIEAYAPGAPTFAISGDDNLSGSSGNDLFVLAQPIGNDTIHSFDFAHDRVDLIGFSDLSSFDDVQTRLSENSNGDAVITIAKGESITFVRAGHYSRSRCRT
jgi:fermentation-respiration switch protein FrsA (DUF1100 family)